MLLGNDMINVEFEEKIVVLMDLAVLAPQPGASAYEFAQGVIHARPHAAVGLSREARALA